MYYTVDALKEYARTKALQAHIDPNKLLAVIGCESNWNPYIWGDKGESAGISQIHLTVHRDISSIEALDPIFSINWMVSEFKAGRSGEWTCSRLVS